MPDKKSKHNRKTIRLPYYDYTHEGAYFITLVTHNRESLFGEVNQSQIKLNQIGDIVQDVWQSIPIHFPHVTVKHFVIMPNHIHGIITIVGARHAVPQPSIMPQSSAVPGPEIAPPQQPDPIENYERFGKPISGSIPTIIRSFKSEATRRVNIVRGTPGAKLWQRNYYEHIIRSEKDYQSIYDYILANPINWCDDKYFA